MDKQGHEVASEEGDIVLDAYHERKPIFADLQKVNEALVKSADEPILATGADVTVVRKPSRVTPRDALPDASPSVHGPPPPFFGAKSSV
jgi:hypothetical protein